jgi:DNA-binding MarR family transcriptional regulator
MGSPTSQLLMTRSRAVHIWLRLARITSRTQRQSGERLRPWKLSNAQFDIIAQVGGAAGPLTQQDLAQRLLVTEGNICQLLDGLQARGIIERRRAGRSNQIFLSDKGQEIFNSAVPALEAWHAARLGVLNDDEQEQLLRLLRKLDHSEEE